MEEIKVNSISAMDAAGWIALLVTKINEIIKLVNNQQQQIDDLIKSGDYNNENPL